MHFTFMFLWSLHFIGFVLPLTDKSEKALLKTDSFYKIMYMFAAHKHFVTLDVGLVISEKLIIVQASLRFD